MLRRVLQVTFALAIHHIGCGGQTPTPKPAPTASPAATPAATTTLVPAPALPFATQSYSSHEWREDVAILREAYEALHPGLYRYNTKAQMDAHFRALEAEFDAPRTLREGYIAISTFLAKIKCGHSYANFYNQDKSVVEALFKRPDRLPFYFRWLGNRMIVTKSFSDSAHVKPGAEVVSIDDIEVATILQRLMTIARADGSNDAKRVSLLEVQGTDEWQTFDIFFSLFFPSVKGTRKLVLRDPTTQTTASIDVRMLTHEERFAPLEAARKAERGSGPVWSFDIFDNHWALLRMRTFALYNSQWDWKAFLGQSFDELSRRNIRHLVIDIRGNEGGLDVGNVLAEKLHGKGITHDSYRRLVRYRKIPAHLEPYLDTWDPSFKDWGADAVEANDGFFSLKDEPKTASAVAHIAFAGNTFVLIDASNSSAAFQFAQMVQENKLGTLLGTPTGGNKKGINGGAFFFLRLPHSKIEVDVPLIGRFPMKDAPDAGIQPDVLVETTVEDIARGVDTSLEMAKKRMAPPR